MIRIAASTLLEFRSLIFAFAIFSTCALVILPTLFLLGTPSPFSIFAS